VAATTDLRRTDRNLSARGSLVYKPGPTSSVYVSYADSFNPSAEGIESLISSGRSVAQANVNADPEQGRIMEAGAKWNLGDGLLISGSVFEIVKSNVRIPDPSVTNANTNGGRQRVRGLELEAVGRPIPNLFLRANYAFLDTETTDSDNPAGGSPRIGEQLAIAPRHSGTVQIDYAITDRFSLGGGVLHQSSRLGQNTNASLLRAPGYTLFDARARYAVTDQVAVQLNVLNIGDELYYDQLHPFHVVPGAGRSALLSIHFTS
jgi:catecholate siderophore receptor